MTKKMRGDPGKNFYGNWEIVVEWTVGVVGAKGQLTQGPNVRIPGTKYKRSNSIVLVTSIALICARACTQLLQPLVQSLIGSPGTLPRGTEVSALDLTFKVIFECLYWFQDWARLSFKSAVRVLPHPHCSLNTFFSISVQFFQMWPLIFYQNMLLNFIL